MPRGLYRFHHSHSLHFVTFTYYHRQPRLADSDVCNLYVTSLERTRVLYGMRVKGFVVMPEHVHLLISEPERGTIANAIQSLKISSAKRSLFIAHILSIGTGEFATSVVLTLSICGVIVPHLK